MEHAAEEKARLMRQRAREAIALAMQSRGEEAVIANRGIIELFPTDIDAYNRLGKALMELGNYAEAKEAYNRALELEPNNNIARKNLSRLAHLREEQLSPRGGDHKASPHIFVEETGKTGVASLYNLAPRDIVARMAPGDQVYLKVRGHNLFVENSQGEYLGQVEPKLGLRLVRLIEGGNRYATAITSLGEDGLRVIIKEVFQHPTQQGHSSFPPKAVDAFRPYTRESLLHYELEDEEEFAEEGEHPSDWEEE